MGHQSGCGCSECADAVRGNPGAPGKSKFLYIAYASDNAGSDFSLIPNDNLEWIQFLVLDSSATTLTIANFTGTWVKFIGNYGGNSDDFIFTTSTSGDPTTGKLGIDNANISAAIQINISKIDASGLDVSNWISQCAASTSTTKSLLRIFRNDSSKAFYRVLSIVDNITFYTINVAFIVATNNSPFADGDKVVFTFSNTGDDGANGADGSRIILNSHNPAPTTLSGVYQNLFIYNMPVIMENDGDEVIITTRFTSSPPSSLMKGFKLFFGATSVFPNLEIGSQIQKEIVMKCVVSRINATTVSLEVSYNYVGLNGGTVGTPYWGYTASLAVPDLDLNITNIIAQGKSFTTAGDLRCEFLTVEYKKMP